AHLADVLNALPGPVDGAVADLTTQDIETLLSRAPLDQRGRALRAIGIALEPRRVVQALCRDVLARLERAHVHDVMHFAGHVTRSVGRDLFDAAVGSSESDDDVPGITARW